MRKEILIANEENLKDFYNLDNFKNLPYTILICNSYKYCNEFVSIANAIGVRNAEYIFLGTRQQIKKHYREDQMVIYRLIQQKNIAMNRNLSVFPEAPREVIIVIDHLAYKELSDKSLLREILISLFHEDSHLGGIRSEKEAERIARKRVEQILKKK